jgi:predicted metal-dependent hydrolase
MIPYAVIRSRRRSAALEVTRDARVIVRVPMRFPQRSIDAFVAAHQDWLEAHLAQQRARLAAAPPPLTPADIAALKEKARSVLPARVAYFSRLTGLIPTGLKITSARTRYGSCSYQNSLCFSCFLMSCPDEAVDLVVVHELCHIRYKNHGKQFYALLGSILPDYKARKAMLVMPRQAE